MSIEYGWDDGAGLGLGYNTEYYRWGYFDYDTETDHFSYSTEQQLVPNYKAGSLKIKREGSTVYFWNGIDSQWESLPFPSGNRFEVGIGAMGFCLGHIDGSGNGDQDSMVTFNDFVVSFQGVVH